MEEREFKGVWIPKEIWLNTSLSAIEKCLITEIDSLDNSEKGCFASNKYLGSFIGVSEGRCANIISSLKKRGFIVQSFFDGRNRGIRLHENVKTTYFNNNRVHESVKAEFTDSLKQTTRIREHSNTVINTVSNTLKNSKKEFSDSEEIQFSLEEKNKNTPPFSVAPPPQNLFSDWWAVYPKKIGREKAEQKFKKFKIEEQKIIIQHTKDYSAILTEKKFCADANHYLSSKYWNEPDFLKYRNFKDKSKSNTPNEFNYENSGEGF